jgi:hypothetical protein
VPKSFGTGNLCSIRSTNAGNCFPLSFVEKAFFTQVVEIKIICSIDINKCRKNILYYGDYNNCVFTVFDDV